MAHPPDLLGQLSVQFGSDVLGSSLSVMLHNDPTVVTGHDPSIPPAITSADHPALPAEVAPAEPLRAPSPSDDILAAAQEEEGTLEALFSLQLPGVEPLGSLLFGGTQVPDRVGTFDAGAELARLISTVPDTTDKRNGGQPGPPAWDPLLPDGEDADSPFARAALEDEPAPAAGGRRKRQAKAPAEPPPKRVPKAPGNNALHGPTPAAPAPAHQPAQPAGGFVGLLVQPSKAAQPAPPAATLVVGGGGWAAAATPASYCEAPGSSSGGGGMDGSGGTLYTAQLERRLAELEQLAQTQGEALKLVRAALRQLYRKYQESKLKNQHLQSLLAMPHASKPPPAPAAALCATSAAVSSPFIVKGPLPPPLLFTDGKARYAQHGMAGSTAQLAPLATPAGHGNAVVTGGPHTTLPTPVYPVQGPQGRQQVPRHKGQYGQRGRGQHDKH